MEIKKENIQHMFDNAIVRPTKRKSHKEILMERAERERSRREAGLKAKIHRGKLYLQPAGTGSIEPMHITNVPSPGASTIDVKSEVGQQIVNAIVSNKATNVPVLLNGVLA